MTNRKAKSEAKSEVQPTTKPAIMAITTDHLNLRAGPSKKFAVINSLPNKTEIIVISRTEDGAWLLVQTPSGIGWVFSQYTRLINKFAEIPVISPDEIDRYLQLILIANRENFSPIRTSEIYKAPSGLEIAPVAQVLGRLSLASPSNIQDIAASQTALLVNFYNLGLEQARKSFNWALIAAVVGLLFFIFALFLIKTRDLGNASIISLISGSLIEVISGINFYLYGKSTIQLAGFQSYLDRTQSILLANSICESLSDKYKHVTRSELVKIVAHRDNIINKI